MYEEFSKIVDHNLDSQHEGLTLNATTRETPNRYRFPLIYIFSLVCPSALHTERK